LGLGGAGVLLTLNGNFINNGTATGTTGGVTIAGTAATQSIGPFTTTGTVSMTKTAGVATFTGNVNGTGLTINGAGGTLNLGASLTHTFTGVVTLTSGSLNGGSSTLKENATSTTAWAGTGTNFTAGTSTVIFGGAAQTLATSSTFYNLTFSRNSLKTLTGVPTITNLLSMEGTASVSAAPTYGASAKLQYNRTANQAAGPEWLATFAATGGVSIINTGIVTANANKTFNASVPLSVASGATLANGGFAISGGSTLTVGNLGKLNLSGVSTFPAFTTTTLGLTSTVTYNGTAQAVAVQGYGNLSLSGSGNKTFAGATNISGTFDISGTAVALLPNGTLSNANLITFASVGQVAGSWGGTTSGATNTNLAKFGSTTTGIINNGACTPGTWLGSVSTDWNNPLNWCGGILPTASTDVIIATTVSGRQPILSASGFCKNISIASGVTSLGLGTNTLTVSGDWTNNGGTLNAGTGTVSFNGTVTQAIGGTSATTFNNLTNANTTADLTAGIGITINGALTISNVASVLDMGTFALSGGGSFTNTGLGQIKTSNTSGTPLPSGKTWGSKVAYNEATGGQTIVGGTYNGTPSLELNNTSGTQTASGNIVTGGQLKIDNGGTPTFNMNGFNLTANTLNLTGTNTLDMTTGTLAYTTLTAMDGTVRFSGATNGLPFPSATVEYYGTTQTVTPGTYYKLLFSGASGVYTMASDINVANTLNVNAGAVTLQAGYTLTVDDAVTVVNPATLTIESSASLLQTTYTGANSGDIIVKRNTTPVLQYDHTYWSSPTTGNATGTQTLLNFSPLTESDGYISYDTSIDDWTILNPTATTFQAGIGYSIRCPATTPSTGSGIVIPHQFVGIPNNGDITIPVVLPTSSPTSPLPATGLSLVGNPYPSAIFADDFINENLNSTNPTLNTIEGTLYFWTHNNPLTGNIFDGDDYFYYNLSGGNGYGKTGTGNNILPTGYIASGQGFFVENVIAGDVRFNNTMREQNNNANFYRTKNNKKLATLERHRIWLNITDSALTTGNQCLVGYIQNATNNYDNGYDSYVFDTARPLLIYSMIGTETMAIQGRALPFSDADTVPIGYYANVAYNVSIAIDHVDGLFLNGQAVYLEDKLLNVIHDIVAGPYVFATAAGTFNDRFVLRYTDSTLGTTAINAPSNTVLVSNKNKQIKINSFSETIDKVAIYDLLGRQIYQKDKVNSNELSITNLVSSRQTLIVKTTLQNGKMATDKIIY